MRKLRPDVRGTSGAKPVRFPANTIMLTAESSDSNPVTVRRAAVSRPAGTLPAAWPGTAGPVPEWVKSTSRQWSSRFIRGWLIPGSVAAAVHLLVLFGFNGGRAAKPAAPAEAEVDDVRLEMPVLAPPETIDVVDTHDAPAPPRVAPPMLMEVPTSVPVSSFVEPMRPTLDRSLTSVGAITIPSVPASFAAQGPMQLFDLKELDRVPHRVRTVVPEYPFELRRAGVTGEVVLLVIIDVSGHVSIERVVSATNHEFEQAAIQAVEQCVFEAPLHEGRRVNARYQWHIPFELH